MVKVLLPIQWPPEWSETGCVQWPVFSPSVGSSFQFWHAHYCLQFQHWSRLRVRCRKTAPRWRWRTAWKRLSPPRLRVWLIQWFVPAGHYQDKTPIRCSGYLKTARDLETGVCQLRKRAAFTPDNFKRIVFCIKCSYVGGHCGYSVWILMCWATHYIEERTFSPPTADRFGLLLF